MNPKQSAPDSPAITLLPEPPAAAQRTHYIVIDYENVQPRDFSRLNQDHFKLIVVVGQKQTSLRVELTEFALERPDQLQLVRTPCTGKNALDFVLACEIGQIRATDPSAYIHIISKDTGFNALVSHLKANKQPCARHDDISKIPILLRTDELLDRLVAHLGDTTKPRPRKRTTLVNTIQQHFAKSLEPATVEKVIKLLVHDKVLKISGDDRIEYQ